MPGARAKKSTLKSTLKTRPEPALKQAIGGPMQRPGSPTFRPKPGSPMRGWPENKGLPSKGLPRPTVEQPFRTPIGQERLGATSDLLRANMASGGVVKRVKKVPRRGGEVMGRRAVMAEGGVVSQRGLKATPAAKRRNPSSRRARRR